jgi:hypothetical protein
VGPERVRDRQATDAEWEGRDGENLGGQSVDDPLVVEGDSEEAEAARGRHVGREDEDEGGHEGVRATRGDPRSAQEGERRDLREDVGGRDDREEHAELVRPELSLGHASAAVDDDERRERLEGARREEPAREEAPHLALQNRRALWRGAGRPGEEA